MYGAEWGGLLTRSGSEKVDKKAAIMEKVIETPVYGDANWLFNHLNTGLQTTLLRTTFTATLIAFFGCPVFCLVGSYYCYDNPAALEKNIELVSRFKLHSHFYHRSDAVRRTVKEWGVNRTLPIVINFSWRKEA